MEKASKALEKVSHALEKAQGFGKGPWQKKMKKSQALEKAAGKVVPDTFPSHMSTMA